MNKKNKRVNKKNNSNKYNAENEIIIGVTTKPKEKARVGKKTTRADIKKTKDKRVNEKKCNNKKVNCNKTTIKTIRTKEENLNKEYIKKINKKKIIVSIIVLFFIALGGTIYYLTTPIFNVTNIIINGNNKNSADTYISLSKVIIGKTNIFAFTENTIKNNLKENSYVEDVQLKRKLPNTIEIDVTERQVNYQIEYANKYIYIDKQGYILEINEENKKVPIIKGLDTINEDVKIGQRLCNNDLTRLDTVIKIVNYCKYNNLENEITSIDATDITNYILVFENEEKTVYIGDSTSLTEKMTAVSNILSNEKGKKGKIFADEDALKRNRVYFREEE